MKAKSFTLVELMVVIMIIGVLASLVVLSLQSSVKKTREARAKDSLKQTQTAIVQFQMLNPDMTATSALGGGGANWNDVSVVSGLLDRIVTIPGERLLSSIPLDGLGKPVQMKWDSTRYVIRGYSAEGTNLCWYVSDKSSNISQKIPSDCNSPLINLGS